MATVTQRVKAYVEKVNDDFTLDVAIASTPDKDRQGEIIEPTAWRLNNFKRNPVLQWAHDYRQPPIGKVEDISVQGEKLMFKPRFAANISPFAKQIYQMFKEGYLNAFSVGFQPLAPKEGDSWKEVELLEISAVPVPANPNALVLMRSMGLLNTKSQHDVCDPDSPNYDPAACESTREQKIEPEVIGEFIHIRVRDPKLFIQDSFRTIDIDESAGIKAVIGKLTSDPDGGTLVQKYLFDKEKWAIADAVQWVDDHKAVKQVEQKAVVRFEGTTAADIETAWDSRLAERRIREWAGGTDINFAQYRRGFAWFNEEAPELLTSYKLPHHDIVDGKLTVTFRGVVAAMGVLLGARGGVDIPEDERKGVYNHLAKHYAQFDREAPEFRAYSPEEVKTLFGASAAKHTKAIHGHITDEIGKIRAMAAEGERTILESATDTELVTNWFDELNAQIDLSEQVLLEAADANEAAKGVAFDQNIIDTTLSTLKLAADAVAQLPKAAQAMDNDGVPKAGSVNVHVEKEALEILRSTLKRANKHLNIASRTIKIIKSN